MSVSSVFEEWAVGSCSYRCKICRKAFLGRARFSSHLDTVHDTNILKYLASHGEAIVCTSNVTCGLCGVQVLHDRSALQDHLGTCHSGFDLFRYYKEHVDKRLVAKQESAIEEISEINAASDQDFDSLSFNRMLPKGDVEPLRDVAEIHLVDESDSDIFVSVADSVLSEQEGQDPPYSNIVQNCSVPHAKEPFRGVAQAKDFNEKSGDEILSNRCEFTCSECPHGSQFTTGSFMKLVKHVSATHKSSRTSGLTCMDMATNVVEHTCIVCHRRFLQDSRIITQHALKVHGMRAAEYVSIAKTSNHKTSSTKLIGPSHRKKKKCKGIVKALGQGRLYQDKSAEDSLRDAVPNLAFMGKTVDPGWIPEGHTTTSVANLCVFRCDICQELKNSWMRLNTHVKTLHSVKSLVFSPECIVETRYHRCKLCRSCLPCDVHFLNNHLLGRHNMRLRDYCGINKVDRLPGDHVTDTEIAEWVPKIECVESHQQIVNEKAGQVVKAVKMPTIIHFAKKLPRNAEPEADPLSL